MSSYVIASPLIVPGPVTATYTAIPSGAYIGLEAVAVDKAAASSLGGAAGVFQFCRGSDVASAGQFVSIQNGSAVKLAVGGSASAYPIGVVAGVLSATNVYGWVQVQGRVDYAQHTNTGVTAGIPAYICAGTAGIVVSNVVAGNRIQGVYVPYNQTNTATNVSYVYDLNRPFVVGLSAAL